MAEQSVKDRVYAAAERISTTGNPTVATAREAAGVSSAEAGRYLNEWRAERDSAGSKIAATHTTIAEQALRLAGAVWEEAVRTATAEHAVIQNAWGGGGLFLANGGPGGQGGPGGAGGDGGIGRRTIPRKIDGFPPGEGGAGGNGGDGGPGTHGGSIQLNYLSVVQQPVFAATGGFGASGGAGGAGGRLAGSRVLGAPAGIAPTDRLAQQGHTALTGYRASQRRGPVPEDQYWASVRAALGLGASAWADARLANGEYFYRRANVPSGTTKPNLALATGEFNRVLQLRPNDALASRFDAQISGNQNVLGLSNSLDVTPAFEVYAKGYTAWGSAVFGAFGSAIAFLLGGVINEIWRGQLGQHLAELESGVSTATADLDAAKAGADAWQQNATNAESIVNSLTQQTTAAKAAMEDESVSIGGIIGTVLEVAAAVVAVVAAIPTAGTSLVALVPAFITLASDVYQGAGAIAAQLIVTGDVPQELKDAYAKAGKDIGGLIAAGKSIMNLVAVINKLDAAKTAANSKYLELVKQALQAGHELLLAMNLKAQADLQVRACQARVDQGTSLVAQANGQLASTTTNGAQLVEAAEILIETAATRRDDLLRYAFMAQRAVEIYTRRDESTTVRLDSGYVSPDVQADFTEGYIPLS
ncbi:DNA-binding protein [Arthrobacter sp. LAPM80]|uniref:DNA-binding protein n=1 Tax=Arthrobacter sp. LAPM80 TaxID=3141788 RepID=UPI00398A822A